MTGADDLGEVRADPGSVDGAWLTAVLERAGVARGATVRSVDAVVEIGTGQAARSARFELSWDLPDGRPSSLVGKFPSADPGARATLESTGGYWKEWLFYDRIAATVAMRVPECFAACFDPGTSDFVLLLEDIRDGVPGDQLDGLDPDALALAVEQAARLHGPRSGDPGLEPMLGSGPGASTLEEAGPFCQEMYEAVLPQFVERFADSVTADAMALIERAAPFVAAWFRGTGAPVTLVHQDLRADNLLFVGGDGQPGVVVVDFQALTAGVGATDVAYLVGGSTRDPVRRAAIERDLLAHYRAGLAALGVDRPAAELWEDYRHGSLWGVIMTVLSSIAAERTERGEAMFAAMAERHARHAADLDALACLA